MDHPLLKSDNSDLRKRVISFLKSGLEGPRESNIVFVCGGNAPQDMRSRFKIFFERELSEYVYFQPEFAMANYFSRAGAQPFDITDFEELVGELSCAIVLFPEAAGSYAEAGYFSAVDKLAKKTLIVLNFDYQASDSFLSLGPAKRFSEKSIYRPEIQLDYKNPDFETIAERIKRFNPLKKRKHFQPTEFSELSRFDGLGLILKIVDFLDVATIEDINFVIRGLFNGHISENDISNLTSILVGAGYIVEVGVYGHYTSNAQMSSILNIRNGSRENQSAILLSLGEMFLDCDEDFQAVQAEARDAN
jgi:hypothetical protein